MINKNQLTTIIDFILAPVCVTLGLTDATHNAILNIILILIPIIGTYLSEKYPDNTIITGEIMEHNEEETENYWIKPIHNEDEDDDDGI